MVKVAVMVVKIKYKKKTEREDLRTQLPQALDADRKEIIGKEEQWRLTGVVEAVVMVVKMNMKKMKKPQLPPPLEAAS